jgi:hypothetical protein
VALSRWNLIIGMCVSVWLFAVVNYLDLQRPATCSDCFFVYGVPFTFFLDEGLAGGKDFVWAGMAGDVLVVVGLGVAIAWILAGLARKPNNPD